MRDAELRALERQRGTDPQAAARLGAELERAGQVNPYQALVDALGKVLGRCEAHGGNRRWDVFSEQAPTTHVPLHVFECMRNGSMLFSNLRDPIFRARRRRFWKARRRSSSSSP